MTGKFLIACRLTHVQVAVDQDGVLNSDWAVANPARVFIAKLHAHAYGTFSELVSISVVRRKFQ